MNFRMNFSLKQAIEKEKAGMLPTLMWETEGGGIRIMVPAIMHKEGADGFPTQLEFEMVTMNKDGNVLKREWKTYR